jgi:LytS/YehU family sensor histidine kinase
LKVFDYRILSAGYQAGHAGNSYKYNCSDEYELFITFFKVFWFLAPAAFLLILFTVLLFRHRLYRFTKRERDKSLLQKQLVQSEMKALRSQMNPHFIFNAINSIQHYVLTNEKDLANRYLVKFSRLMRNILDLSKEELITLRDELETVRLYLEIESMRFTNAFSFGISCAPEILQDDRILLPPLLIQPFVENAIWHGLLLKNGEKRLSIDIVRDREFTVITVDDNGIGRKNAGMYKKDEFNRRSLGMEITQSRLDALRKSHKVSISYKVIDKAGRDGQAEGTTVIIKIKNK